MREGLGAFLSRLFCVRVKSIDYVIDEHIVRESRRTDDVREEDLDVGVDVDVRVMSD